MRNFVATKKKIQFSLCCARLCLSFVISYMYICFINISETTSYQWPPSSIHINSMLFFLMMLFVLTLNAVLMIKISNQNMTVSHMIMHIVFIFKSNIMIGLYRRYVMFWTKNFNCNQQL